MKVIQPQFEVISEAADGTTPDANVSLEVGRIVPVYESAGQGKLTSRWFRHAIHRALEQLTPEITDAVPNAIQKRLKLPARRDALQRTHWPEIGESISQLLAFRTPAQQRLIFE